MKIIDVSRPVQNSTPTWPGDTPFDFELMWTKEASGSVNVGKIEMSTHTGTHIDAPFHFDSEAKKVHELDLSIYCGKAKVIHLQGVEVITAHELKKFDLFQTERLLIRTDSWDDPLRFPEEFSYFHPDAAAYLKEIGVRLVGVDVPSVDFMKSKELPAHHSFLENSIFILEGLDLSAAEQGDYELIALPLRIVDGDGSPVRAVLRTFE
ncbi:arylformamidase [Metabacillus idriensis]|uniref:arylformamidase n=1 Tax=Metabacillus idriensis TaxID=324768 RepID=UPI0028133442|nr:arylformamidase [Metabacillus idriensis]MDR0140029.1 arylformamidase [Metabacillus idriensis]